MSAMCVCGGGRYGGTEGRESKAEKDIGDKYGQRECSHTREAQCKNIDRYRVVEIEENRIQEIEIGDMVWWGRYIRHSQKFNNLSGS